MSRRSKPWEEVRDAVLAARGADADGGRGLALLRAWDGDLGAGSAAGTVYVYLLCELAARVAKAKAPVGWEWALGRGFGGLVPHTLLGDRRFGHLVRLLNDRPAGWFARPWADEVGAALGDAVRRAERAAGRRVERAAWGTLRKLRFKHLVFGDVPGLRRAFNPPALPGGGDSNTVFQSTVQPLDPLAAPAYVPNLRVLIDVGAWHDSRFAIAGGQSGDPASPHYDDQLAVWARGEGVPIPWTPAEVDAATVDTLELIPVPGAAALAGERLRPSPPTRTG